MPGGRGALIVIAAAVIGTAATVETHRGPGYLLGGFVVAGTLAAALAVRPRAVYLLIPVPALAYIMGAVTAGMIHQQSASPGSSGLTVSAAQWIADGFVAMTAATVLAAAITVIRWLLNRSARPARRLSLSRCSRPGRRRGPYHRPGPTRRRGPPHGWTAGRRPGRSRHRGPGRRSR